MFYGKKILYVCGYRRKLAPAWVRKIKKVDVNILFYSVKIILTWGM
jgi:hypothetical protein